MVLYDSSFCVVDLLTKRVETVRELRHGKSREIVPFKNGFYFEAAGE